MDSKRDQQMEDDFSRHISAVNSLYGLARVVK